CFLAEALGHGLECRVAYLLGLEQLLGEIIDRLLVGLEPGGPLAGGDVGGDRRLQAGLEREAVMRVPLVLRRPVARDDEDCQLLELLRQRVVKAHLRAELLRRVAGGGAVEEDAERAAQRLARPGQDVVGEAALLGAHLVGGKRLETLIFHGPLPVRLKGPAAYQRRSGGESRSARTFVGREAFIAGWTGSSGGGAVREKVLPCSMRA